MGGAQATAAVEGVEGWAPAALELARRFAAGATLWCVSPEWPWHAGHVAVEFVHPVVVGKRALPAVALSPPGWLDELRLRSCPGDALMAIAPASGPLVAGLARARIWGLATYWIGAGPAPLGSGAGPADHLLWVGHDAEGAAFGGDLVRAYHVMWELTHVCFEHPGLLAGPAAVDGAACITCSDEGRLAEVIAVGRGATAGVRSAAGRENVDVTLVEPVQAGDVVLVHAGTAVSLVSRSGD